MLVNVMTSHRLFHHHEYRVRMVNIQGDRETKLGGQVLLDIYPILARVETLIDATMVLLVQYVRLSWMLDQPVNALPKFWILVRHEVGPCVLIGEDPTLSAIVRAHT